MATLAFVAAPALAADRSIEAGRRWWAFQPVRSPAIPEVADRDATRNPIDAFIRVGRVELDLAASPEADPITLIRRLTYDLTGLPPRPAEVDAFLADPARRFAERVAREAGADPDARLTLAHRLALGRPPSDPRRRAGLAFLARQSAWHAERPDPSGLVPELLALADLCHTLFKSNAFLYVD